MTDSKFEHILRTKFNVVFQTPLSDKQEQAKLGMKLNLEQTQIVLAKRKLPLNFIKLVQGAEEVRLETRSWKEPMLYILKQGE